jgi:hypothetical protein
LFAVVVGGVKMGEGGAALTSWLQSFETAMLIREENLGDLAAT